MTLPRVDANTMRSSGAKTGSKLWTVAPLLAQLRELGVAAMASFLAHEVPSTLTVQIAKGSLAPLRAAKTTLSPFHDTEGCRMSAVAAESPAQPPMRLRQAPPPGVIAPVVASIVRGVKQRS